MNNPRTIPADEARAMRELLPGDLERAEYDVFDRMAKWLPYYETYAAAPDLAHTVVEQAAQIERVRKALHRIEQADEQAQHDWDAKADMWAQGAAMGYAMAAQWVEEALGDTDDAAKHTEGDAHD